MRGKTVIVKCKCCKDDFIARVADRKRGWGNFCSKSCKAIQQIKTHGDNRYTQYIDEFDPSWDAHKLY